MNTLHLLVRVLIRESHFKNSVADALRVHDDHCPIWVAGWLFLLLAGSSVAGERQWIDHTQLQLPVGFQASVYADDELAHDIFCMTTDSKGRIVVSGPGYIRILEDPDQDGKADSYLTFAENVEDGAQGMVFDGDDLLCIAGPGLVRYVDRNRDGLADAPPQMMLKLATGGEHNAHAIHRGPDGWWYLITGNTAGISGAYATLPTSPVKHPYAGVVLRLNPALSGGEIFADGVRNAYDFDFTATGELLLYDSDTERDVSLPSYRPTRIFHAIPGSHQGWITDTWKDPDYGFDISPVVGETGRGSPTGVVTYRHHLFPQTYHNCVFAMDWTFGRIWAVHLKPQGSSYQSEVELFAQAVGNFGFAPTGGLIGKDGALYVCVGGRGTRGCVYRIAPEKTEKELAFELPLSEIVENTHELNISEDLIKTDTSVVEQSLTSQSVTVVSNQLVASDSSSENTNLHRYPQEFFRVVDAPQPLSSWSRNDWLPFALLLNEQIFITAIRDTQLTDAQRIRSLEILTELYSGPDVDLLTRLSADPSASLRARAAWSIGRSMPGSPRHDLLKPYLDDRDAWVARSAWETLVGSEPSELAEYLTEMSSAINHEDRHVRLLVTRLAARLPEAAFRELATKAVKGGWTAAIHVALIYSVRSQKVNAYALNIASQILRNPDFKSQHLDAVLLIQSAVGSVGPAAGVLPGFEGYTPLLSLASAERELDPVRILLEEQFPTEDPLVNHEMVRTLAMLSTYSPQVVTKLLDQITQESNPTEDIHILTAMARIPAERDLDQLTRTAQAMLNIREKLDQAGSLVDTHFEDRMMEIYEAHVKIAPSMPAVMVQDEDFGWPDHVRFLSQINPDDLEAAMMKFVEKLERDPDNYPWTEDAVFVLAQTGDPEILEMIRGLADRSSLRAAVLMSLAEYADPQDRELMLDGLQDFQVDVVQTCLTYFVASSEKLTSDEIVHLYAAARKLDQGEEAFEVRSQIMDFLMTQTGQNHGFIAGQLGFRDQSQALAAWGDWLNANYPEQMATMAGVNPQTFQQWRTRFEKISWASGDPVRGQLVFETASCARCHGGTKALGPDLSGVAKRFSREDLLTAIVAPSRDVSSRYQTFAISTLDGHVFTGLIVYESVDGVVLRDAMNKTYRVEAKDIDQRQILPASLMPDGLVDTLTDQQLADLIAYLESLGQSRIALQPSNTPQ